MAMVWIITVGFMESCRLVWTFEVLQEAEGARCMGLRSPPCAYSAADATNYVFSLAGPRGVTINAIALSNAATRGGAGGFAQDSINYDFVTMAPVYSPYLRHLRLAPASAGFPNNS